MTILKIPDLGGASDVEVIEVLVAEGETIEQEQALIVLETDKASMEIPAESAGQVSKLMIQVGDKVNEGDEFIELASGLNEAEASATEEPTAEKPNPASEPAPQTQAEQPAPMAEPQQTEAKSVEVAVPDLGGASDVDVIEVSVRVGEEIDSEQTIIVLETDKASMEIPAGVAGEVAELLVKSGDKVSQGDPMLVVKAMASGEASTASVSEPVKAPEAVSEPVKTKTEPAKPQSSPNQVSQVSQDLPASKVHAGPAVRKLAREFGVDLTQVKGSGPKNRVLKSDVQAFVKERVQSPVSGGGAGLPQVPKVDFAKFGAIRTEPLNNIKRATAKAMTTAWLNVPQVTQFDQADITDLEAFRKAQNKSDRGVKFSIVPFVMKALAKALQDYPTFNASLSEDGQSLIMKEYVHIGVAVDTPKGLLVPVVRDIDKKSITQIAQDVTEKAQLARDGKLSLQDMQGGCISVSSLGGVGGTAFTPIVNPPEVAILGLSRAEMKPVWNGSEFIPKLMLPTSLSYDHRVIDGAEAARFSRTLAGYLEDMRTLIM